MIQRLFFLTIILAFICAEYSCTFTSATTAEVGDFTIELVECKSNGDEIACTMTVTNKKHDAYIGVKQARIFDHEGNEYHVRSGSIYNRLTGWSGLDVIKDVPAKFTFGFGGNALHLDEIKVLEIQFQNKKRKSIGKVQMRDISIKK